MLVHTGWGRFWTDAAKTLSGEPGLGRECATWAVDHDIICWGCDQAAIDVFPFETEGEALPMHLEMLTKAGIRLMENIYMDEIVGKREMSFAFLRATKDQGRHCLTHPATGHYIALCRSIYGVG